MPDTREDQSNTATVQSITDAAIKLGLPVFACSDDKRPVTAHGFKDATLDAALIATQFAIPGATKIGVPMGATSGLVAVDVDIRDSGMAWLDLNSDALPKTRAHRTRSGGLHLLFKVPDGIEIRNSQNRVAPGVDVRGEGGYVIWPPSPGYQIADATEPADMPRWLIRECLPPEPAPVLCNARPKAAPTALRQDGGTAYGLAALRGECDSVRSAPFGQQEATINAAGLKIGALVAGGELDEGIALADLLSAGRGVASQAGKTPWRPGEVEAKLRRAFGDGMRRPRSAPAKVDDFTPPPNFILNGHRQAAESGATVPNANQRADAEPVTSASPLVWLEDIAPVLIAQDFVQGVLLEGGAAVVYGESNSGKTFWTTDMALHVAAGMPWQGRRVDRGGVVYCVLEGGNGFRNRVAAWRSANLQPDSVISFAALPTALNLLDGSADVPRLIQAIKDAAAQAGEPVKLVVIDTLSRALAGGDENSSEDMGALVRAMDAIRQATGACVLFVHHSGKDAARGARGHSLLRAAIDTEIEVRVDEDAGTRNATVVKQRDLVKGAVFTFQLRPIVLGPNQHGEDVTTCLVEADHSGRAAQREHKLTQDERGWLNDISAFFDDPDRGEQGVSPAPGSSPVTAATRDEIRGWLVRRGRIGVAANVAGSAALSAADRSNLSRYLNRLRDKGKIQVFGDWIWLP